MDIRKYIKELLFLHDCVIIPGFGGFVTSYQSSEIQRFKNVVYPPSKSLLFNRRLQTNDGILVNHIAQQEKIDYRTAEEKVRQSCETWNRLIDNKGMLLFPDIGKLYINSSSALVFLPELRKNYLMDTFGLKPIAYHANTDSTSSKIIKMERKKPQVEETESGEEQQPKSNTGRWVALAAAAVVLLLLIPQLFLQNMLPQNMRIQQLNVMQFLNPDSASVTETTKAKKEAIEPETSAKQSATDSASADAASETSTEPIAETTEETAEPKQNLESLSSTGNFYIVFGESDFISDAIRLKKQLDSEHGKTFEIFSASDGNYVVGLKAGESQEQAEASLGYFRSSNSDLKVMVRE